MVDPYFVFKNRKSTNIDIVIKDEWLPPTMKARDEVEIVEVPGRDGYLTIYKHRKEPIIKTIKCILVNRKNRYEVRKWLQGKGKLILSNENDVFYLATIINSVVFFEHWNGGYEFEVEFLCQPHGYLPIGEEVINITKKDTVLRNPTNEVAKPFMKIYGSGSVDLIINNNIHKFNIDEYVEVDSELMESYKDTLPVIFTGEFPKLDSGENKISWDGNISKIEIIPRWRR